MIYDGMVVGVTEYRWSSGVGGWRPETGQVFISLYIKAINLSNEQRSFSFLDFDVLDGGGEIGGRTFVEPREPAFDSCTVISGGTCEGWWTTSVWDRPEVRSSITLRWLPDIGEPIQMVVVEVE